MEIPRHEADVDTVVQTLSDVDAGRYGQVVTPRPEHEVLQELRTDADRFYAHVLAHAAQERRRDPHSERTQQLMEQARAAEASRPRHSADTATVTLAAVALAVGYAAASVRREGGRDVSAASERDTANPAPAPEKSQGSAQRSGDTRRQRSGSVADFGRAFRMTATAVGPLAADETEPNLSPVSAGEVLGEVGHMNKAVAGMSADVFEALKAAAKCVGRGSATERRKASSTARDEQMREQDRSYDHDTQREYAGLTL